MQDHHKPIRRLVIALAVLASLVPITVPVNQSSESTEYMTEDEWNESFELAYGSNLPDFYGLGEEGFQARWLSERENAQLDCKFSKHCVFIRLATIAECEKGVVVKFSVSDKNDKEISQELTPVFLIESGQYVVVELGSKKLTDKGFIEPLDAYCSDVLPSV